MGRKRLTLAQSEVSKERRKAKDRQRYLRIKEGRQLAGDMADANSVEYFLENALQTENVNTEGDINAP